MSTSRLPDRDKEDQSLRPVRDRRRKPSSDAASTRASRDKQASKTSAKPDRRR